MPSRFVTGDGRLALAYPGHISVAEPGSFTDELAMKTGERFRLYTCGANTFQSKDSLVQAGGCETGRYTKTNQLADGGHPDSWYSYKRDASGAVVRRKDARWGVYPLEPSNLDYRAYHQAALGDIFKTRPHDAAWFQDSAGTYSYTQGIARGEKGPLQPDHASLYARGDWLALIRDNLDTWAGAFPTKRLVLNGLDAHTISVYAPCVGQIEGAFGSVHGILPGLNLWETTVSMIRQSQGLGWTPWVFVKLPSWQHAPLWRPLMVATALLCDEGSLLYGVSGIEGTAQSWEVTEYDHPWYGLDLGVPLSPMQRQGSLAYRFYDEGFLVVANPDARAQTLSVPGGGEVRVAAQSGGVYEKAVTWTAV